MGTISFLVLAFIESGLSPPDWSSIREAFAKEAPELLHAKLELLNDGRLELQLDTTEPLAPEIYDDLLASFLTALPSGPWYVRLVGPEGQDLAPKPLSAEHVERLAASWRANRPQPGATWQAPAPTTGALRGVRIGLSAGHGVRYTSGVWSYQRGPLLRLIEDIHNNEIIFRHLAPMLEGAGAEVLLFRERSPYPERTVVDNDGNGTSGSYAETGEWLTGGSPGHGGTFRYTSAATAGGARATWTLAVVRPDYLPVYVWYAALANRNSATRYVIDHAAGSATVMVDQRFDDSRWRYLGTFPFVPWLPAAVHLENTGVEGGTLVVADAVRLGGGQGFADLGGGVSGHERWEQCAAVCAIEDEVPSTVRTGTDDVATRPALALWQGVDLFVSVHSNAGGGTGTSTFVYSNAVAYPSFDPDRATSVPPGTLELQEAIHAALIETFRAKWDPSWRDRGMWGADFGELRPLTQAWRADGEVVVPGVLLELAFHDDPTDAAFLREDRFRADAARAIYRGIVAFVHRGDQTRARVAPLSPRGLTARVGPHGVELSWTPADDPLAPSAAATHYDVEVSGDGWGFSRLGSTEAFEIGVNGLSTCDTLAFRVVAVNDGGTSLPSRPAMVRVNRELPRLLWVDGDRRLERTAFERPEGPNTVARMLVDLEAAQQGSIIVESTRAEVVGVGGVSLADYDVVVWSTGETSSTDDSLSPEEQIAISQYLSGGGALLLSGAEIAWDLVALGSSTDQAFFSETLQAAYVADDADTFSVSAAPTALWLAAVPTFTFDDGTGKSFLVDWPDVIEPLGDAVTELTYATGGVAAVRSESLGRLFYAGFPLEAIESTSQRREIMARIIDGLLARVAPAPVCGEAYGEPLDDGGPADGDAVHDGGNSQVDVGGNCGCRETQVPVLAALFILGFLVRNRRL